jgi:hypothetical protein
MKQFVIAEVWKVEARFYVQADSEDQACNLIQDQSPDEHDFIEVLETIVQEVDYEN